MANIMDLFSQPKIADIDFDIEKTKGIYERIKKAQDTIGGRPRLIAKVGSGGVKIFQFTNGSRDIVMESFRGIIIAHHKNNVLFPASSDKEEEKMNKPPICSSSDGITGIVRETGECRDCENCPYNIFGTDGKGKACKNMHRLYILVEGSPIPVALSLPPTSLELWRNYAIMDIAAAGLDLSEVVTEFGLINEVNDAGQKYSIVTFKTVGKVNDEVKFFCAQMGGAIEEAPRLAITGDEYNVEPTVIAQPDEGESTEDAPAEDEDDDDKLPDWENEGNVNKSEENDFIDFDEL